MHSSRWSLRVAALVALAGLDGCLGPESSRCGDLYCPSDTVCAEQAHECVTRAQLSACSNKPADGFCSVPGAGDGFCRLGVCQPYRCGDGVVSGSELCDDGNTVDCDGCSSDCNSDNSCGNHRVECDEECDDGENNSDAPDALCRTSCKFQRCNDGIVDHDSGEDCDLSPNPLASCEDYGFYGGELSCSVACRNDTSTCVGSCGDGELNGEELCDALPPAGESCLEFGYDVGNLGCSTFCTPAFEGCERLGFDTMPLGLSAFLIWVWGSATDDIYAVGDANTLIHYDGTEWATVDPGMGTEGLISFNGVWGTARDDVFVVGGGGTILHFDGDAWKVMESGSDADLNNVWGRAADDVFAVGWDGVILHYDGREWSSQDSGVDAVLWNVQGTDTGEVFVAGDARSLLRYDDGEWSALAPPVSEDTSFYGVWPIGSELYVSGDTGTLLHYDGEAWSSQFTGTDEYLYAFWGIDPSSIYVAGTSGTVLHYDGRGWYPMNTGTTQDLFALWGPTDDDLFAVGPGTVLHLAQGGPNLTLIDSGTGVRLNRAWGTELDDAFVVGEYGTILRFDGKVATPMDSPTDENLLWLWGSGPDDIFATGAAGTILHFDGDAWSAMNSDSDAELTSVWGTGPEDVFVTGENGTFLHYDGHGWSALDSGTDARLYEAWGSGPNDVFVAGGQGTLLHYDGETVTPMELGATGEIWGIWGTAPDDVYAFADIEGAFHYDGTRWSPLTFASSQALDFANGSSTTDLFSLTTFAVALFHYDGLDWAPIRLPPGTPALHGVWMTREGGYLTAAEGMLLRVDRQCAEHEKNCEDRWDNDCDGLSNCSDPDCGDSDFCALGGICRTKSLLECGSALSSSTAGAKPKLEVYGCSPRVESGREAVHRFESDVTVDVSVTLSGLDADLDLIVLGSTETGACDPRMECVTAEVGARSSHVAKFVAEAGKTYFIVVEGYEGAYGDYALEVACR